MSKGTLETTDTLTDRRQHMAKLLDKKTTNTLALLVMSRTGSGDNVTAATHKVVSDYIKAKKIIIADVKVAQRSTKKQAKSSKAKKAKGNKQPKAVNRIPANPAGE